MSEVLTLAAGAALGAWGAWNGRQCWRSRELDMVVRYEREHGHVRWLLGGRNKYQTPLGASYLYGLAGAGFVVIFAGYLLRELTGQGEGWWLWWAICLAAAVPMGILALLVIVYFWFGLPDALRPPAQRGVKLVRGEYVVVRPQARPPA